MAGYVRHNPLVEQGTDAEGTRTAAVTAIGRRQFMDNEDRMPAFVGLAKYTGGYYAENPEGISLEKVMQAARMDFTVKFQQDTRSGARPEGETHPDTDGADDDGGDSMPVITVTTVEDDGIVTVQYPFRGTYAAWPDGERVGFGMVRSRYQIVQPWAAGELGQALIDEGGANCVAGGIYGNPTGARSYLAFKLPEGLTIGGESSGKDHHDLYLTILNSYDGQTGLTGLFAPIRLACTNMTTVTFGREAANRFSFRHSGNIEDKIKEARKALGIAATWTELWQQTAETLLAQPLAGTDLDEYLLNVMPTPNTVTTASGESGWARKRIALKDIITTSDTCEFGRGTAYAALQGVQEWADWLSDTKKDGDPGIIQRFTRTLNGTDMEKVKLRAAALLGV
jgi:phage/plasmid-like protein (TIGR03299 family)